MIPSTGPNDAEYGQKIKFELALGQSGARTIGRGQLGAEDNRAPKDNWALKDNRALKTDNRAPS